MRIFFDTEFTSLEPDNKLISIGLIDETGKRTFYAELCDTWQPSDASEFTVGHVLPLLEGDRSLMTMSELALRLGRWLESINQPVRLATDSPTWDWSWIQRIFEISDVWPANLDKMPVLLTMAYLNDYDGFDHAVDRAFADGLRRHHALDDAKANRLGWLASGGDIERHLLL